MVGRKIVIALFLNIFLVASVSQAQKAPNCSLASSFYSKDSINIITFGASTVAGVGGVGFQGFLKKHIEYCYSSKTILVENFGVPGETTTDGIKRIDAAIANKNGFIFILMGANDAMRIADNKMRISDTESSMRLIIQKCIAQKLAVVIGTIQNFNSRTKYYQKVNSIVGKINTIYKKIAADYNIQVADINATLGFDPRLYSDVVHPNNRGYYVLSLVWFDALNRAIEANFLTLYISQNFPNPTSNSATSVRYTVPSPGIVQLSLFDLNGRFVRYLINEYENAGLYTRELDLSGIESGLYIYVYQANGKKRVMKMLVSK